MRIHIKGGGWYGCHLALALRDEHEVLLTERSHRLFNGASGSNPARLHIGPHYPRSHKTRQACREHAPMFMAKYGHLTRYVPHNIYAIAERDSLLDYGTYLDILKPELALLEIPNPTERGLCNVEGAIQISERHIVIDKAREWFTEQLAGIVMYGGPDPGAFLEHEPFDLVIDCTFCAGDSMVGYVERFEPCITVLLEGPCDTAVTVMDGPFPSLYPWDESRHLLSLTSAKYTPLARCATHTDARDVLDAVTDLELGKRVVDMRYQIAHYYPDAGDYDVIGVLRGIRAMPASAADARLVEVVESNKGGLPVELGIRAGKIDAIFEAERQVRARIETMNQHQRAPA